MSEIEQVAAAIRQDIVQMITAAGSGHPGGSLSAADIVAALYFDGVMRFDPQDPQWPKRDRFILSKGHAAPVLYAALARAGYFDLGELNSLRQLHSRLQGHPDSRKLPGVEVSTGSLGQGLSIAAGLAAGLLLDANAAQVYVLLGDGELQEGQVWEAAMFAAHRKLGNLVAIVDNNNLQIDGHIQDVNNPQSITEKFAAFGFFVLEVDGHDIDAISSTLRQAAEYTAGPVCIVAHTVKGRGVDFMEDQAGWHGKAPSAEQCDAACKQLKGGN